MSPRGAGHRMATRGVPVPRGDTGSAAVSQSNIRDEGVRPRRDSDEGAGVCCSKVKCLSG